MHPSDNLEPAFQDGRGAVHSAGASLDRAALRRIRAAELIERGGSKLGLTQAILELNVEVPVPFSSWRFYGDRIDPLINAFQKMRKPVIVRGCHKNDVHGLIDVLPTKRDITTLSKFEEAVAEIETVARSENFRRHCLDWGQEYSPEVHILLQEQIDAPPGLALEHPHHANIMLNCYSPEVRRFVAYNVYGTRVRNNDTHTNYHSAVSTFTGWVETLKSSGILDPDWAFQYEFALSSPCLYQARPFKLFSPAPDFELPDPGEMYIRAYGDQIFGITPEEGISLSLKTAAGRFAEYKAPEEMYALLLVRQAGCDVPNVTGVPFRNLAVYGCWCEEGSFLKHGNYQFMKRTEISFCGKLKFATGYSSPSDLDAVMVYFAMQWPKGPIRVFSNARGGLIIPD